MDIIPTPTEPDSLAALHAQDAAQLRVLFLELANLGAGIVRVIARAVDDHADTPAAAPSQLPALAAAHDQTMRSLRRTALLIQKLTEPVPAPTAQSRDATRHARDRDAPEDLSQLSDAELDRMERMERMDQMEGLEALESDDELAQRPLAAIIATILRDFGVTGPHDGHGAPHLAPADITALYDYAADLAAARQTGVPANRPVEVGEADAMRRRGATGCRDP
jgi:hypothetical protein